METIFIQTSPGEFRGVFMRSDEYESIMALPQEQRPVFFEHDSKDVQAWLLRLEKARAIEWVMRVAEEYRVTITSAATARKMSTWPVWKQIAQAVLAGTVSDGDRMCFQIEIAQRGFGETIEQFAEAVMRDAIRFQNANGLINGIERSTRAEIEWATSLDTTGPILMAARQRAEQAFVQLMSAPQK